MVWCFCGYMAKNVLNINTGGGGGGGIQNKT